MQGLQQDLVTASNVYDYVEAAYAIVMGKAPGILPTHDRLAHVELTTEAGKNCKTLIDAAMAKCQRDGRYYVKLADRHSIFVTVLGICDIYCWGDSYEG